MKIWIVCDNNNIPSIVVYDSLEKAQAHTNRYDGLGSEDCWIFNKEGSEVKQRMNIEIHRVSCRACGEVFNGITLEEAKKKHRQHIKSCETIKALEKIERFQKEASKILKREVSIKEAMELLGVNLKG